MHLKDLLEKSAKLPALPGVYIMKDSEGQIIYVGKSKTLKNRVHQYFTAVSSHTPKVRQMVQNIADFEYILAPNETEALLLENNLIKLHRPKYNILLKDDKTYPYLAMDINSSYPRLSLARRRSEDGRLYFGPFENAGIVRDIRRQAEQLFSLASCRKSFPAAIGRDRPCLQYHIGHCCGVCRGDITPEQYREKVNLALSFLKGDYKKVIKQLQLQMQEAAAAEQFEKAAVLRDRIKSINRLGEDRVTVLAPHIDCDIIAQKKSGDVICVALITVRAGRLCRQDRHFLQDTGISDEPLLAQFIQQYYEKLPDIPPLIYTDEPLPSAELLGQWLSGKRGTKVQLHCPSRGKNKELVRLAQKNAAEGLDMRRLEQQKEHRQSLALSEFLGVANPIRRIEMYDISQFGEDNMVGGMIVWQNGRLQKNKYRRFTIKWQRQRDDYRATAEVLTRRLERLQSDADKFGPAPDFILLDGGKGHVGAVSDLIHSYLPDCLVMGLVKDGRHRTRALVDTEGRERGLAATPHWFSFFSALQQEVHRYAISYMHKSKRRDMLRSELSVISGLGPKRYQLLLRHFKTRAALMGASVGDLTAIGLPASTAHAVYEYFQKQSKGESI